MLGNREKLRAGELWRSSRARRGRRHHRRSRETRGASGRRLRGPRPRLRRGAAGLRPSLHLLHHPARPRPEPLGAGGRDRAPGARAGRSGLSRGGADRRRHHLLRRATCRASPASASFAAGCWRWCRSCARLRLSSLDPAEIDDELWRLIAEEPRLMPHLHLSLQAGDDLILKRMKRRHSRAEALARRAGARATLRPGIALGADLIAGFPTEDEAMFAAHAALRRRGRARLPPRLSVQPAARHAGRAHAAGAARGRARARGAAARGRRGGACARRSPRASAARPRVLVERDGLRPQRALRAGARSRRRATPAPIVRLRHRRERRRRRSSGEAA